MYNPLTLHSNHKARSYPDNSYPIGGPHADQLHLCSGTRYLAPQRRRASQARGATVLSSASVALRGSGARCRGEHQPAITKKSLHLPRRPTLPRLLFHHTHPSSMRGALASLSKVVRGEGELCGYIARLQMLKGFLAYVTRSRLPLRSYQQLFQSLILARFGAAV